MPQFATSTGKVSVSTWGYELQGRGGRPLDAGLLASATHDLLVIDASRDGTNAGRFLLNEVTRIKDGMGGRSVAAAYLSIGEADDFRDYWKPQWTTTGDAAGRLTAAAPSWLGPLNPEWPESRNVRYWDPDWQRLMFNDQGTGDLDAIVQAGFDAAYLDIVEGYYVWSEEIADKDLRPGDPTTQREAARRMVDFVVTLTEHARETNPDFFVIPQNAAWILEDLGWDPARKAAYLDAIGGIAVEDLYCGGDRDENNPFDPDEATIRVLQRDFLAKGRPVFVVDYIDDPDRVARFEKRALADGFIPFAAPDRDLDRLAPSFDGTPTYIRPTERADSLRGSTLADRIDALSGDDRIEARSGRDSLHGGGGDDTLVGGSGGDILTGGSGADRFVFHQASHSSGLVHDTVRDFSRAEGDRIDLRGIDADARAHGDQSFDLIGLQRFHHVAGELRVERGAETTLILGDADGDGQAEFRLRFSDPVGVGLLDLLL